MAYLRLIRFGNVLFIGLFQVLLRYCVVLPVLGQWNITPVMTSLEFSLLVIATMAFTASGNAINDYFDVRTDSINRPEAQVVDKLINRKTTILIHVLLTLVGLFCGLYLAFDYHKETYAMFFVVVPIVLWFYSTHFKKQIFIGNLIVATMMAITSLLVVSAEISAIVASGSIGVLETQACNQVWKYTAAFSFFGFITNLAREIVKDMEDVEGDMQCGCHTIPVEMGLDNSKVVVIMLEVITVVVLWVAYFMTYVLYSCPFCWLYILLAVTLPICYIVYLVARAKTQADYHKISRFSKIVMFFGVLIMVYVNVVH